ncbi:MAG: hypothetical protein M0D55_16460 [Elusimicrobiota bacterium]|nr:MAG: hypothetical protein M0D55_16460 [Elusimicrobiota bacterium]
MALPLAAVLAVLVASAHAQTGFKEKVAAAFEAGSSLAELKAEGQPKPLVELYDQALYVQGGREPGDDLETHQTFVRSVARRLGAPPEGAIERYGALVRPPRAAGASRRELAARAALAADVTRNPGISAEKKARVAKSMAATNEYLKMGLNGDASFVGGGPKAIEARGENVDLVAADPAAASETQTDWTKIPPRAQPIVMNVKDTPSPAASAPLPGASAGAIAWATLTSYIDWEKGKQVAREAYEGTLSYIKKQGAVCYRYFKQAMIDAGIIDAPNPQSTGLVGLRPAAAAMFSQDVKKNPKILERMGYRQADVANVSDDADTIPDGTAIIYGRGCGFADEGAGHAEIALSEATYEELRAKNSSLRRLTTQEGELRVCHFSCTTRRISYLRALGKRGCLTMYVPVKKS